MGIFWISLGFIFYIPSGVAASYSPTAVANDGFFTAGFNADLGLWLVAWGLAIFVVLVCSIKTNITFIVLFTILDAGLFIFAGSHFQIAAGNLDTANILQKV
jgi:uncharacterized protein